MADRTSLSQRIQEYQPSKTVLFWSGAACVATTMIVGFTWGGWVTGGTAEDMAGDAADRARAGTAAAVCVDNITIALLPSSAVATFHRPNEHITVSIPYIV